MRYRREVDGLRAVAVVPVILFHAGFGLFGGGFVGVDVFFVISGYLITSIIMDDLREGRFSLLAFYERRVRRLLPALFVVMAACCVFGYLWMLPNDLNSFGKSLLATSLFTNNIYSFYSGGYWALPAQFKPLLHTWSLAIEEQFYILLPLFLLAAWTYFRRWMFWALLLLTLASLCAAQTFISIDRQAAFYLLPTRAWELLMGSLVARFGVQSAENLGAQIAGALGLLLIVSAVLLFGRTTPTPSLYTLVPTVGAALVILFASEQTIAGRLLATPALVTIGLISYSLYLWHYPVFAFARIYAVDTPRPRVLAALLAGIVPAAYLSWRFVETPFRSKAFIGRKAVFTLAAVLSLVLACFGYLLFRARGLPSRFSPEAVAAGDDLYIEYNAGAFRFKKDAFDRPKAHHLLVVGNSFARDVVNMTVETFDLRNVELLYRNDPGSCVASWPRNGAALLAAADVVVLASRSVDLGCVDANLEYAGAHRKKIYYVGTKYFGVNLNWLMRLKPQERREQSNPLPARILRAEAEMSRIVPADHYVSLLAPIMKESRVPITDSEGRLISPDRTHLTRYGAKFVGRKALADGPLGALLKSF